MIFEESITKWIVKNPNAWVTLQYQRAGNIYCSSHGNY